MRGDEILAWALDNGAPLPGDHGRRMFRCSATLRDGTFLPCVLLRDAEVAVADLLSIVKHPDVANDDENYLGLLRSLHLDVSRVASMLIARLEPCRYAIPWSYLADLPGDRMNDPVAFTATMDDGARFAFDAIEPAFLNMPDGYSGARVRSVEVGVDAEARTHRDDRICFVSFVEGVEFGVMSSEG